MLLNLIFISCHPTPMYNMSVICDYMLPNKFIPMGTHGRRLWRGQGQVVEEDKAAIDVARTDK